MIQAPVRLDSICELLCQMASRRPPVSHQETNRLRLLGLAVPPAWRLNIVFVKHSHPASHLTTQEEEGLETTLAGSTVHSKTPDEQPTAS